MTAIEHKSDTLRASYGGVYYKELEFGKKK